MLLSALFAFLHYLAAFGIVGTLLGEWLLLGPAPTLEQARRLQALDRWYGILAGLLLVVGALRVFQFEKGAAFYLGNPFFHLKLTLFVVVGLLSIYPTVRFIAWRKDTQHGRPPQVSAAEYRKLRAVLHLEMVGLVLIAASASLMARGIGH